MKLIDLPTAKFPLPWGADAGGGYIRPIPVTSQIGIQDGAASLTDGFPPLTMTPAGSGGVYPFGQDTNGILNQITLWVQWLNNAGGPLFYDSGFSTAINGYPEGAILAANGTNGTYWLSLSDDNTDDPDAGPSVNWVAYMPVPLAAVTTGDNTMVATLVPAPVSLAALTGLPVTLKKNGNSNSITAVTLTLNGFTSLPVVHPDGSALFKNEIPANSYFTVVSTGSQYQMQGARSGSRIRAAGNVTLYVGPAGNDSTNTGLTSGSPFLTPQHAWDVFVQNYDMAGFTPIIRLLDGIYTTGIIGASMPPGCGQINVQSDSGVAANCLINAALDQCFEAARGATMVLSNIKVTNIVGDCLQAFEGGVIHHSGMNFGTCAGAHINASVGSHIEADGDYAISGAAASHMSARNGVVTLGPHTVTITGTPAFTQFVLSTQAGFVDLISPAAYSGSVTGPAYTVTLNGVFVQNGVSPPTGASAGSSSTGGQVV
jgi:hypothetical protein